MQTRRVEVLGTPVSLCTYPVQDFYLARCPEYDVSATGDTEGSAAVNCLEKVEGLVKRHKAPQTLKLPNPMAFGYSSHSPAGRFL